MVSVATILASCSKEEPKLLLGQYSGSYFYQNYSLPAPVKSANDVVLNLDRGNTYDSNGLTSKKPAGGSGNYMILKNNAVEFTDKNIWTADFDWNLILNGRFIYELKEDSLILTRYMEPCPKCIVLPSFYQYRLKRIN